MSISVAGLKALLLAAGKGERMRPLTEHTPKPLLRAAGKSLIEYHIENCRSAGIVDLVINHAWLGEQIEMHLGDGSRYGVRIEYSREGEPLETLGGIMQALPRLTADAQHFLVINSDIWTDYQFVRLLNAPESLAHLVMVDNPPQHPRGDFVLQNQRLSDAGDSRLTFAGMARYHADFFNGCVPGKAPLAPLLRQRMQAQCVTGEHYSGRWFDIGTIDRLQQLDHLLTRGI